MLLALAGVMALPGCGIHLEENAPAIPLIPRRTPVPGESDLLALLHGTLDLANSFPANSFRGPTGGTGGGSAVAARAAEFAQAHAQEAAVLDSALRRLGVPADLLAQPSASTSGTSAPGSSTTSGSSSGFDVLAQERAALALVSRLYTSAPLDLLPTLASLAAARSVVCRALTPPTAPPPSTEPTPSTAPPPSTGPTPALSDEPSPTLSAPPAALAYLAASRAAVYGFEVVAARTRGEVRTAARRSLDTVRGLALAQETLAGGAAPPAPTAYRLPLLADDAETGRRLAEYLAGGLLGAYGRAVAAGATSGADASAAAVRRDVATGARWLGDAALLADDWGMPLAPFPGLS